MMEVIVKVVLLESYCRCRALQDTTNRCKSTDSNKVSEWIKSPWKAEWSIMHSMSFAVKKPYRVRDGPLYRYFISVAFDDYCLAL